MKVKEILARVTGLSTPFGGISWTVPKAEKPVAFRVLSFLADRRILYSQEDLFRPAHYDYTKESIFKIREYLTSELGNSEQSSLISESLRAIRASCRLFLDELSKLEEDDNGYLSGMPDKVKPLARLESLGRFRGVVGVHVARLAAAYEIDTEPQLDSILPAEVVDDD